MNEFLAYSFHIPLLSLPERRQSIFLGSQSHTAYSLPKVSTAEFDDKPAFVYAELLKLPQLVRVPTASTKVS